MTATGRIHPRLWKYMVFTSAEAVDSAFSSDKALRTADLFTRKALLPVSYTHLTLPTTPYV